jgi:hypothetical protein
MNFDFLQRIAVAVKLMLHVKYTTVSPFAKLGYDVKCLFKAAALDEGPNLLVSLGDMELRRKWTSLHFQLQRLLELLQAPAELVLLLLNQRRSMSELNDLHLM